MSDTYRLHSSVVDEDTLFVDATVTNVDLSGTVHLEETVTDPRTWTISLDDFDDSKERNLVVDHSDIEPDHETWTHLQKAYELRNDPELEQNATSIADCLTKLFRMCVYAHKQRV